MLSFLKPHSRDRNVFLRNPDTSITYEETFDLGRSLFTDHKKDLVLILCDKDVNSIVAYVGSLICNKVPLLIDKNYKKSLVENFIENYRPTYIISEENHVPKHHEYSFSKNYGSYSVFRLNREADYKINDNLCLLMPTSGSTGDPKCVRISQSNIESCTEAICEYLNYDEKRVAISLLPIHYSYGLSVLHNAMHCRGSYVVSKSGFLDKGIWDELEQFGVTDISGVPFMMKILNKINIDPDKVKSLSCVTQAGGYLPEKESSQLFEKFKKLGIDYFTMYGQTEASPRISYLSPKFAQEKPGTAGIPISCGSVFIKETGETIGTGELCYKGPNVALGYAFSNQDLSLGDDFKGVLETGDIAEIDTEGFIKIIGRNKRFVKIAGISVNLDKIEKDLQTHFGSVATVGKDEKIVAISAVGEESKIKDFLARSYNFNKTQIKICSVTEIPLNSSGKFDYKFLTESYC